MLVFLFCLNLLMGSYAAHKRDNPGQRVSGGITTERVGWRFRVKCTWPPSQLRAAAPSLTLPTLTDGETEAQLPRLDPVAYGVLLAPGVSSERGAGRFQMIHRTGGRLSIRTWGPVSQHRTIHREPLCHHGDRGWQQCP